MHRSQENDLSHLTPNETASEHFTQVGNQGTGLSHKPEDTQDIQGF